MDRGEGGTGSEMEVEVDQGETSRGGVESNNQEKPREKLESLSLPQHINELEQTGEDSASGISCTPCLVTKALKLPTIKEKLDSIDQWQRLHGTREETATSLEQGLTSLNIRNQEDEVREDGLGFCAAISLADGTVLHTTQSLTATLGYPGKPLRLKFIVSLSYIGSYQPTQRTCGWAGASLTTSCRRIVMTSAGRSLTILVFHSARCP